jgi:HK97 family phage major capsid protein
MATVEELGARIKEIEERLKEIDKEHREGGLEELPEPERGEWNQLAEERVGLEKLVAESDARRRVLEEFADRPATQEAGFNVAPANATRGDDIWDLSTVRAAVNGPEEAHREMKDRAKRAMDMVSYSATVKKEDAQENIEFLLDTVDTTGSLAKRMLETGSPTYQRAFGKKMMDRPLTDAETRALSTTDGSGGFAIPFTLDPTVIHTSNYSVNPYRAISRVIPITGDNWQGIASGGVSATYAAEATEVSDGSPSFTQPAISPSRCHVFVPFSVEIGQDWGALQTEITSMIQESKDDLEATKFTTGSGTNEPFGLQVGGTAQTVTASTATFVVADVYRTEADLPPRSRPRAQWIANRAIYNRVRQFDTAGGAQLWTENLQRALANNVPTPGNTGYRLLGYEANECTAYGTALASGSTIATLGDFQKFVIVDRIGMNVEIIPHLFGTVANFPTGQRGLWAMWRNGSKVVDAKAFKSLVTL